MRVDGLREVVRELWRGGPEGIEVWMKGWRELERWGRGGCVGDIWKVDGYWVEADGWDCCREERPRWMDAWKRKVEREKKKCGEEERLRELRFG